MVFDQTVPLKYVIDAKQCLYFTMDKCRACEKFCPTGAVNFSDTEEIITLEVGSVVMSQGFVPFDPSGYDHTGYGNIPDVVTSLEYERMLSSGGPSMGRITRPSDHRTPRKTAWIQCVGSRSMNRNDKPYCSSICCMSAIKQTLMTVEKTPGGGEQTVFFMDIRTHGKELEAYYLTAEQKGVNFIKARPHTILPGKDNLGVTISYITENGTLKTASFDLCILSIGMGPAKGFTDLAAKLDIRLDRMGFPETDCFNPASCSIKGIFAAGSVLGPMSIRRVVTQASTAAASVSQSLLTADKNLSRTKIYPEEIDISLKKVRIGLFVCSCGSNIAGVVDVKKLTAYAQTLPGVVHAENTLFACSTDNQTTIAETVAVHAINRIVIAACTPRTHEPLFQETLKEIGLNPGLIEMANIRNHNSWVHKNVPELATLKAKDQVRMAVAKVSLAKPRVQPKITVVQKALVVGGGLSGLVAAWGLARQGYETFLVEKAKFLGGNAWKVNKTVKGKAIRPMLAKLIRDVESDDRIRIFKNAAVESVDGSVGSFKSRITFGSKSAKVAYGACVLATGGTESVPDTHLFGRDKRILTNLMLEAELKNRQNRIRQAQSIVFIQCVGSRDERRPYCSRICCIHTVKSALALKKINPAMEIHVLYRDIRTYGLHELSYTEARKAGVIFIHYTVDNPPEVRKSGKELYVRVTEPILGRPLELKTDFLILAAAIVPTPNKELADLFKLSLNSDGFINEAHPKLRPVDLPVAGLFVAGMGNFPRLADESVGQAKATVSRASAILLKKEILLDPVKAFFTQKCDLCALCLDVCPFKAIKIEEKPEGEKKTQITIDTALCQGCGICAATCPKDGILVHGFTNQQLRAQVDAALEAVI